MPVHGSILKQGESGSEDRLIEEGLSDIGGVSMLSAKKRASGRRQLAKGQLCTDPDERTPSASVES